MMFGEMRRKTLLRSACAALAIAAASIPASAQELNSGAATQAEPTAIPLPVASPAAAAAPSPALSIPLVGILGADVPPAAAPAEAIRLSPAAASAAPATPGGTAPAVAAAVAPAQATTAGPRVGSGAAAASAAVAPPPVVEPAQPLAGLWPLDLGRVTDGQAMFRGERDSLEFTLFVPPGEPARELTLSAVSSAFILPGRSMLRVYSGDLLLGEMPLRSITTLEKATMPIPAGVLTPGVNRIRIEVDLAHRLYCGALPAYDLWTKVDLAASGVPFAPETMGANDDAFFAAANVARAEQRPLLIRAEPEDLATSEAAREVIRRIGQAIGGGLTFTTRERPLRTGEYPSPVIEIRDGGAPGVRFRLGPDGEQILDVRLDNGAAPALFDASMTGAAGTPPPALPQDVPVPLSRLGFSTVRISEHLWSEDLAFRLPPDWLMNVRERAVLNLGYAYLPGMPTGAELRVLVNGAVVRIIPLDRGGRLEDAPLEVRFDAGLLSAGRNVLGFEVVVPGDPADEPCLTADVGRVEIRDSSTLIVPSTPSMHMPGITRWLAGGGPLRIEAPSNAVAAADDVAQSETYLNLAAALHGLGETDAAAEPRRLVVLRPTDLSSAVFGEFAMGRQNMLAALQRPGVAAAPAQPPLLGAAQAQGLDGGPLTFEVERNGYLDMAIDRFRAFGRSAWQALGRLAFPDPVADLGDWLSRQRGQALLFQLDSAAPNDLNLLISPDARPADVLNAIGQAAERGAPLEGHLALLTWDGDWVTWTDDTRLPVLEERLDQANWRGVVGNFASAQPRIFVGLLVGIALISVLIANSYLAASRKQR